MMVLGHQSHHKQIVSEGKKEKRRVEDAHEERPEVADGKEKMQKRMEELHGAITLSQLRRINGWYSKVEIHKKALVANETLQICGSRAPVACRRSIQRL